MSELNVLMRLRWLDVIAAFSQNCAPRDIAGSSDAERRSTAAGGLRVRIADHELRAVQAFGVVDFRAHQVLQAERIDDERDALLDHGKIVGGVRLIETEAVLEPRAAAAGDVDPQLEIGVV